MVELKKCCGHKGHWECDEEYPDHIVPISEFNKEKNGQYGVGARCKKCHRYSISLDKHPITGKLKRNWKADHAKSLGGTRGTLEWKSYLDKAEVMWGTEIKGAILKSGMDELKKYAGEGLGVPIAILKFKSKKPKFNQVQYEGSPSTPKSNWRLHIPSPPKDNTKEVVPQEGPGDVYVMIDTLKMPGLVKIGTTTDINERLDNGNTWGAFSCLYKKAFQRSYEAEAKVHELLDDYRIYSNKEWFEVNTDFAIKTIEDLYELL